MTRHFATFLNFVSKGVSIHIEAIRANRRRTHAMETMRHGNQSHP